MGSVTFISWLSGKLQPLMQISYIALNAEYAQSKKVTQAYFRGRKLG